MTEATRYKRQITTLVDAPSIEREQLCTIAEAAKILGCSIPNISQRATSGQFTVYVDTTAHSRQARRLLLRSEIESERT